MDELQKLEQAIEGIQAKIELQKASNQKLRDQLGQLEVEKDLGLKEVNRLKETGQSMQNSINEKKKQVEQSNTKEEMNNFLHELRRSILR